MASRNHTFKLTDDDAELLDSLASSMRTSKTSVVREALRALDRWHGDYRASAQAFIDQLRADLGNEAVLVFHIDDQFEPYVTVDGERRDDIYVVGQATEFVERGTGIREDYIWVFIGDRNSDVRLQIALFPIRSGVTLALPVSELTPDMQPRPVAWVAD